jgi:hypothetical protein
MNQFTMEPTSQLNALDIKALTIWGEYCQAYYDGDVTKKESKSRDFDLLLFDKRKSDQEYIYDLLRAFDTIMQFAKGAVR